MDYDEEKVDEFTLALLYLVVHERQEGLLVIRHVHQTSKEIYRSDQALRSSG